MHPDYAWPFLSAPSHPVLSALWAVFAHGSLGVIVVLPIIWRSPRRFLLAGLAFIGALALDLDLDHVVEAGSFDTSKLEHLGSRPDTHSLLFVGALALIALAVTRSKLIAWAVFAVLVSHLLFDAAGGGERWLYPLQHPDAIPWLACPVGIVLLTAISAIMARATNEGRAEDRLVPGAASPDNHGRDRAGASVVAEGGEEEDRVGRIVKGRL
jgi:membrane-bound metal-dependent hydrolase YbcI (DUF457 family)